MAAVLWPSARPITNPVSAVGRNPRHWLRTAIPLRGTVEHACVLPLAYLRATAARGYDPVNPKKNAP